MLIAVGIKLIFFSASFFSGNIFPFSTDENLNFSCSKESASFAIGKVTESEGRGQQSVSFVLVLPKIEKFYGNAAAPGHIQVEMDFSPKIYHFIYLF